MSDWKARLVTEESELRIKHDKLYDFIGSEKFKSLEYVQRVALEIQMLHMKGYLETLIYRADLLL
jgi:hypothetical protein